MGGERFSRASRHRTADAKLRILDQERLAVWVLAGLKRGEVVVQEFQKLGVFRQFVHGPPVFVEGSSSAACNLLIARIQSICTAGRERSMRWATSLNGRRSRLRRTTTS